MFVFYKSLTHYISSKQSFSVSIQEIVTNFKVLYSNSRYFIDQEISSFQNKSLLLTCDVSACPSTRIKDCLSAQALLVWTSHTTSNLQMKKESPGTEQTEIINLNINTQTSVYSNDYESNII